MTVALVALGYLIGVLLVVVVIQLEIRLNRMEKKRVDYQLFLTPDDVVDLLKRDPVKQYFGTRPRGRG